MKILEEAYISNDIKIRLEDYRDQNNEECPPHFHGLTIAAYPRSKSTGKIFRLTIEFDLENSYTNENVMEDFTTLKDGRKTLKDFKDKLSKNEKMHLGL